MRDILFFIMYHFSVQGQFLQRSMSLEQDSGSGILISFSGLDPYQTVFHVAHASDSVYAAGFSEFTDQFHRGHLNAIQRHWLSRLEPNLNVGRLARSDCRGYCQFIYFFWRLLPRVLQNATFYTSPPQIRVYTIWACLCHGDGDIVFFGILDLLVSRLHIPFSQRSYN